VAPEELDPTIWSDADSIVGLFIASNTDAIMRQSLGAPSRYHEVR
jgi:hypothetical protein